MKNWIAKYSQHISKNWIDITPDGAGTQRFSFPNQSYGEHYSLTIPINTLLSYDKVTIKSVKLTLEGNGEYRSFKYTKWKSRNSDGTLTILCDLETKTKLTNGKLEITYE